MYEQTGRSNCYAVSGEILGKMPNDRYFIYLVRCSDSSLYTGITKDVALRVKHHNMPKLGAKYTRARQPVTLAYLEEAGDQAQALRREYQIKQLSKMQKEDLVATFTTRRLYL